MDKKQISLVDLRKMQKSANVMRNRPSTVDVFYNIPTELMVVWSKYLNNKDELNAMLKKYDMAEV